MITFMLKHDGRDLPVASENDGGYPRPQLVRSRWRDLGGVWNFGFDDEDSGVRERWFDEPALDRTIVVPFPPESPASNVNDTGIRGRMWYHRIITEDDVLAAGHGPGRRLMLRFGAVDYRAVIWMNGHHVGGHEGGHTPFSVDVTEALSAVGDSILVVRVEDDAFDVAQPRGKQDWREHPHVIWYHRTSGIWQPVWLESVPEVAVDWIHWQPDLPGARVLARIGLSATPDPETSLEIDLRFGKSALARTTVDVHGKEVDVVLSIHTQTNGQSYEELLWSPERPNLIDAVVKIQKGAETLDSVASYLGLRSTAVDRRLFLLNDRPRYVRSVLSQGYWPESHLATPSTEALRAEVELIKSLGFNAARLHQKFEDPRFLYWADRLGLMVWAEAPAAFTFTSTSAERTVREWLEVVHRDLSHPSIVTWVPLNESWGVQHLAHDERMLSFARALVHLTKALDPARPVVSNDGWEQADTDIVAIHDYEGAPDIMRSRYRDRSSIDELIAGVGPAGRRLVLSGDVTDKPVMLTEFGGISFDVNRTDDAWGYTQETSADSFRDHLSSLMSAIHRSDALAGYCYTQLTDTLQETNGLVDAARNPKLPPDQIRRIMLGPRPTMPWE